MPYYSARLQIGFVVEPDAKWHRSIECNRWCVLSILLFRTRASISETSSTKCHSKLNISWKFRFGNSLRMRYVRLIHGANIYDHFPVARIRSEIKVLKFIQFPTECMQFFRFPYSANGCTDLKDTFNVRFMHLMLIWCSHIVSPLRFTKQAESDSTM